MFRNVFTKDIWDRRSSIGWWIIGMVAMTGLLASIYPTIRDSDEMQDVFNRLPPELLSMFGIDPATFLTGAGYLQGQLFSFVGPIIVIAFCVLAGVAATSREEHNGTMDMLLSLPVRRSSVLLAKAASLLLLSFLIVLTIALTLVATNQPIDLDLSIEGILAVCSGLWLLGVVFGGVAMAVGALTGSPSRAAGFATALAVAAWFIDAFSAIFSWLEWPARFSPFNWYLADIPLISGRNLGQVWLLLASVGLIASATYLFTKRNIATEQAVLPETTTRRRKSKMIAPRSSSLLRSVFGKSVWDRRKSVWIWAIGMSLPTLLTFAAWPSMAADPAALAGLIDSMPRELFALFGLSDTDALTTPEGFVSSRTYGSVGPVVIIVFSIGAMTSLVAREESKGTLDLVLSNPQQRRTVLSEKASAVATLVGIIVALLFIVALVGNAIWDLQMNVWHIAAANIGLGLLGMCFWGVALAMWSLLGGSGPAVGVTATVVVVTYFLNGLGAVVDFLEPFRVLSPFYWYLGDTVPLGKGLTFGYLALAIMAMAGTAVALARFRTRDLAV